MYDKRLIKLFIKRVWPKIRYNVELWMLCNFCDLCVYKRKQKRVI